MFKTVVLCVMIATFVGCGGGNDSNATNIDSGIDLQNDKKTEAIITDDNIQKFTQAVHYLEKLDFDIDTDPSYSGDNRKVDNQLNSSGIGSVKFEYENFEAYNGYIYNGTVRLEISIGGKIKADYELTASTKDNNITLDASISSNIDNDQITLHHYRIYDAKNHENIEVKEGEVKDNKSMGKLYLGSEGYVFFENTDETYNLEGKNSQASVAYVPAYGSTSYVINVSIDGHKKADLYYRGDQVTKYDPPKFAQLEYVFNSNRDYIERIDRDLFVQWQFTNKGAQDTTTEIEWYVNDQKIETENKYLLPQEYYTDGDKLLVILTATHGDISTKKEILIKDDHISDSYDASDIFIDYYSNSKIFDFDLTSNDLFPSFDENKTHFVWSINDGYENNDYFNIDILDSTENKSIPKIKIANYGVQGKTLQLRAFHDNKLTVINVILTVKTDYFTTKRYTSSDIDNIQKSILWDMNEDGYLDYVYCYVDSFENKEKLAVRLNDKNGSFDILKHYDLLQLEGEREFTEYNMEDLNGDGLLDIVLNSNNKVTVLFQNLNHEWIKSEAFGEKEDYHSNYLYLKDLNGDGLKDIIATFNNSNELSYKEDYFKIKYQKDGDIWREAITLKENLTTFSAVIKYVEDLNGDGLKDIILNIWNKENELTYNTVYKYIIAKEDGSWSKSQQVGESNQPIYVLDMDDDGVKEVIVGTKLYSFREGALKYLKTLDISQKIYGDFSLKSDFNSDGQEDIVLFDSNEKLTFLLTSNNMDFDIQTLPLNLNDDEHISKLVVKDINFDGENDLILYVDSMVGVTDKTLMLLFFKEKGTFKYAEPIKDVFDPGKVTFMTDYMGDFNGDNFMDIAYRNENMVLINKNSMQLKPIYLPYSGHNRTVSDLNRDGVDDILQESSPGWFSVSLGKKSE